MNIEDQYKVNIKEYTEDKNDHHDKKYKPLIKNDETSLETSLDNKKGLKAQVQNATYLLMWKIAVILVTLVALSMVLLLATFLPRLSAFKSKSKIISTSSLWNLNITYTTQLPICDLNKLNATAVTKLRNISSCWQLLSISAINKSAIFAVCNNGTHGVNNYAIIYNVETEKSHIYYKPNVAANIIHVQYLPTEKKTYKIVHVINKYAIVHDQEIIY